MQSPSERIIVALDDLSSFAALKIARDLSGRVAGFKINSLFTGAGPTIINELAPFGPVMLDCKFHDIPNTVRLHCAEATHHGVNFMTIHALGGVEMMAEAMRGVRETIAGNPKARTTPKVLAITILTSQNLELLRQLLPLRVEYSLDDMTLHLAQRAKEAGVDGVVCSPREARSVREAVGPDFLIVCPGIRPAGSEAGDQKRIDTPRSALENGADFLVVGRPVTKPQPRFNTSMEAFDALVGELAESTV